MAVPSADLEPWAYLARGTVANILKKHGIEPPERIRKTTWKEFLTRGTNCGR